MASAWASSTPSARAASLTLIDTATMAREAVNRFDLGFAQATLTGATEFFATDDPEQRDADTEQRDGNADRQSEPCGRDEHRGYGLHDEPDRQRKEQSYDQDTPPEDLRRVTTDARRLSSKVEDAGGERRALRAAHRAKRPHSAQDDRGVLTAVGARLGTCHG